MKTHKVDKLFLIAVAILTVSGFFIFSSASLGLLTEEAGRYSNIAFKQTFFGLFLGTLSLITVSRLPSALFRKMSLTFFVGSIILTLLVFMPGLGLKHGGAQRWIDLGFISFQPSEFLKIGYVLYLAAYFARQKQRVSTFTGGLIPLAIITGIAGGILLLQPDTDTFAVMGAAGLSMFIVAGGKWRHIFAIVGTGMLLLALLAFTRPYVMSRITTFLDPQRDTYGASYQIQQSLIAIGSGQTFGRGFGQSIQKFEFLPEPIGDSIFAVLGEEFGFFGTCLLISFFLFFTIRGLKIASETTDVFGRLVVIGLVILIITQAFINMGGMLSVIPLSGISLPFVSHGGTALFVALMEAGIILAISRNAKQHIS